MRISSIVMILLHSYVRQWPLELFTYFDEFLALYRNNQTPDVRVQSLPMILMQWRKTAEIQLKADETALEKYFRGISSLKTKILSFD